MVAQSSNGVCIIQAEEDTPMNRLGIGSIVALGFLVLGTSGRAAAQVSPYQPYSPYVSQPVIGAYARPGLSPYLNLLRGGSPAANYYLGVVPERQRRAAEALLGSSILDLGLDLGRDERGMLRSPEADDLLPRLPGTGHVAVFNLTAPYFSSGFAPRYGPLAPLSGAAPAAPRTRGTTVPGVR